MILRTSGIGVSIAFLREAQWGSRGREFDSRHSDHKSNDFTLEIVGFFSFTGWPHLVLTTILTPESGQGRNARPDSFFFTM